MRAAVKQHRGALICVLASMVATVNAYRPLTNKGRLSLTTMAFGLLVSEFPLQTLVAQVSALTLACRPLSRQARRRAWLLSALPWLGLLALKSAGHAAEAALSAALKAELDTMQPIEPERLWRRPPPQGATAKTPGPLRMLRIYRDYAHGSDISYGPHGTANLLDLWRLPDLDPGERAPVLLQVPGGAWAIGNKRGQAHPLMSHLAELGWVCVSINYRLSPQHTWPDHIVDVKRAIAWIKDNIADYGGDPDFIAVTGGSAGGHLSALAALTPNHAPFQPGFADADTRVQAAIPFYGVYDFTRTDRALHPMMLPFLETKVMKRSRSDSLDCFRAASPISYAGPHAPPFFVLHGINDSFIPLQQARSFTARLREVSRQPVVYAELRHAQHAFDVFGSARAAHAAVAVERFLAQIYAERLRAA
jgi:acetyl esterase/lipase